mmetsp:Transcript_37514/g.42553  ORF Transcript_37514/g.42553 Transcript_37514/m.42553 type:complete len:133 (+) Transcript_37514:56-454(+)
MVEHWKSVEARVAHVTRLILEGDDESKIQGVIEIRKILGAHTLDKEAELIINSGVVPILIQIADGCHPTAKAEALWALVNLSAGASSHVGILLGFGFFNTCRNAIKDTNATIQEHGLWAIGNLAGSRNFVES